MAKAKINLIDIIAALGNIEGRIQAAEAKLKHDLHVEVNKVISDQHVRNQVNNALDAVLDMEENKLIKAIEDL